MFISLVGSWVQTVAQSWLVFSLTNSTFLLGLVGFLSTFPVFALSLFGGVAADRIDKRKILLATQAAFMVLAFMLAFLNQTRLITPFQIMIIASLNGIVMAFDGPCRQSVIVELVGREHLLNAIALNSAAFNSARIIGPALAGILIANIGMSGCFFLNGVSFLAVIVALVMIRSSVENKGKRQNKHFFRELWEGIEYLKDNRVLLMLIAVVGLTSFFGMPYVIMMPVFAEEILGVGAKGFGVLMSFVGAGALIAALSLARMGNFKHKGRALLVSAAVFCLSLMLFALSRIFALSLVALVFVGWSSVTAISIINTLLQTLVPDHFRGRIMSAFMFTFAGVMPFGNLLSGSLAHIWGAANTLFINAAICFVFFVVIHFAYPQIKRL